MVRTLQQHIQDNYNELDLFTVNNQRRRHLESELECLEKYYKNHPNHFFRHPSQ